MKKFKVTYTSGGGTEYPDGEWELKHTPKTMTVEKTGNGENKIGIYAMHKIGYRTRIGEKTGNPIKSYFDDFHPFVVYFEQAGTPYYFDPIV